MNKVEEIFKAWNIALNPDDKQAELAAKRIEICNSCEHKVKNLGINRCSVCGCALKGKIFSPVEGACPEGYWDEVDKEFLGDTKQKNLRFMCAQPATVYYAWQVEVLLHNFIEVGINLNNVDIVCGIDDIVPEEWRKLAQNYSARFFFYKDTRKTKNYISSIRPNILKQHFKFNRNLKNDVIFYHDCDIMFTRNPTRWITKEMMEDDNWYGSDTRWYLSHSYIKSKGKDVLELMSDISGISIDLIEKNEQNAIGAQYLLKGITHNFWERVEFESEMLFEQITELNKKKKKKQQDYHELQIWCADMWALLWNGWKMGKETICHENFNFSWATSPTKEFFTYNIFHNAGVTEQNKESHFFKGMFINELPYNYSMEISDTIASHWYFKFLKSVGTRSVLNK